jgi:hypothetical protein
VNCRKFAPSIVGALHKATKSDGRATWITSLCERFISYVGHNSRLQVRRALPSAERPAGPLALVALPHWRIAVQGRSDAGNQTVGRERHDNERKKRAGLFVLTVAKQIID